MFATTSELVAAMLSDRKFQAEYSNPLNPAKSTVEVRETTKLATTIMAMKADAIRIQAIRTRGTNFYYANVASDATGESFF